MLIDGIACKYYRRVYKPGAAFLPVHDEPDSVASWPLWLLSFLTSEAQFPEEPAGVIGCMNGLGTSQKMLCMFAGAGEDELKPLVVEAGQEVQSSNIACRMSFSQ